MHRCYIETKSWIGNEILPSPEEAHHILHVLRAVDGEGVRLFDGTGGEAAAVIRVTADGSLMLAIQESLAAPERGMQIVLVQAVLKGNRMDLLIEKATELGVTRIVPAMTQRTIPRLDGSQTGQKKDRWERIAISAAKQCGTRWLPVIESPLPLLSAVQQASAEGGLVLLASLTENTRLLAVVIDELRAAPPTSVVIVIGPEGDFTPEETFSMLEIGAVPVSLGNLTLRAETAAIFAVSAVACMLRHGADE